MYLLGVETSRQTKVRNRDTEGSVFSKFKKNG